jgi:hypothetical protein
MQKHLIHSYCISETTKMWAPESKSGPTSPHFRTHQPPPYANFFHHKLMQTLPNPPIRKSTALADLVEFKVMKAFKAHNMLFLVFWTEEAKVQTQSSLPFFFSFNWRPYCMWKTLSFCYPNFLFQGQPRLPYAISYN